MGDDAFAARFRFVVQFVKIAMVAELDEWSQAHVDRFESAGPDDQTANEPNQQSINGSTGIAAIRAQRWFGHRCRGAVSTRVRSLLADDVGDIS